MTALPSPAPDDPLPLVARWLDEAVAKQVQPNPNALTLATASLEGAPSARIVLIKGINEASGYLVFYSHYPSRKGRELDANPRAAGVVHWDTLGRQLRVEGQVTRSPAAESDAYFAGRPVLSRVNAWASDQSQPIADRAALLEQARQRAADLGLAVDAGVENIKDGPEIPRPAHWGGFRFHLNAIEFWVHGDGRFHDRLRYQRDQTGASEAPAFGPWSAVYLQP